MDDIKPAPPLDLGDIRGTKDIGVGEKVEIDFTRDQVEGSNFAFSPAQLHQLLESRSTAHLQAFGGIKGVSYGLRTDLDAGLSIDEDELDDVVTAEAAVAASKTGTKPKPQPQARSHGHHNLAELMHLESNPERYRDRMRIYGENRLPKPHRKSFLQLAWMAFNDKLIFLLTASATISLALGIYEAVVGSEEGGSNLEWVESVTIMVAIAVIVLVSATNDYHKNYCFEKLNKKNDERWVTVIRSGTNHKISVFDILVGDILRIEAGDIMPIDGVLCQGSGVDCDESSITGEAHVVHKTVEPQAGNHDSYDPFIFSGTRVVQGVGFVLVTSIGPNSIHGRMQLSLRAEVQETPLQQKLGRLAKYIIIVGFCIGTIFFFIIFIRWAVRLRFFTGTPEEKGKSFLDVFMLAVTVVLIGVPEGLSLAVAVALAFATTRMLKDKNLVRLLRSCEIMGNATTICSDKTGTLTQNQMSVVAGIVGDRGFGMTGQAGNDQDSASPADLSTSSTDLQSFFQSLSTDTKKILRASVALNSTAFEQDTSSGTDFVGSSTETALLRLGRNALDMGPLSQERHNTTVVELLPFSSRRKWMATIIKVDGKFLMLVKGAAEIVTANCSHILQDPTQDLAQAPLDAARREEISQTTQAFSNQLLRPIALAYRELDTWPLPNQSDLSSAFKGCFKQQMTLLSILGIRDPLRPEVVSAVKSCQAAGVFVRMVTGDNFTTAKAIASECGIYTAGGIAMDGPTFRKLSEDQLDLVVPRLQVLARSSPDDKQVLVRHLKKLGETVAVTGDGTNDAFALKAADIGFAMGISGTDIAKEACAIVLMDDNFASIVKALAWGRAINDAAKKFIQFQFTINITAGILTIVSTLVADIDSAVFAVIQLLWLNLIMDIFAALALATDFPTKAQMERRPEPRNAPIVNARMWKMILGQALYQLVVVFTLHYKGETFFAPETHLEQLQTLVFNVYMFMQVFNQINCRRVDNLFNIFEGVHRNPWFIGVQVITIGGQVAIIIKGGNAFQVEALSGTQWGWCIFFGFLTLPIGAMIRLFPDRYVVAFGHRLRPVLWPVRKVTTILRRRRAARATAKQEREESEDEPDEERRIRRMQWTKHSKKRAGGGRHIGSGMNTPAARRSLTIADEEAASKAVEHTLQGNDPGSGLIEAIRHNRLDLPAGVEVHPRTSKDDPVLFEERGSKVPPSQHQDVLRYLELP